MSRLSIELTVEEHKRVKAVAAMQGCSIRDYVLERILPSPKDDLVLRELDAFLAPRIKDAQSGNILRSTALGVFEETLAGQ
ncbi:MAG: antitoxin [Alphaproteobacteria bacterium]|nr:antitoxin [Alphaproteobacteria bacterium]